MSIMPLPTSAHAPPTPLDVRVLAVVLASTEPELHAPGQLPGETLAATAARREATADIVADLLNEQRSAA